MDVFTLKGTISVDASTAKSDIDAIKKAADALKTALDNVETAANDAETELDQVATAANNAETNLENLKSAANGAEKELEELDTASTDFKSSMDALDKIINDVEQELRQLDTAADDAADELGDIDTQGNKAKTALQHVGTYATTAGKNLDSSSGFSTGAHYAANLLWELSERAADFVWELGKMGMDFNASMETWSLQLTTLLGADDIEVGKAFLEEIRQFAIDTPLALDQAVQSAVGLLASGINSEDVIDTLWMLGDIAMGDTEKLSRIALVYSQIMAGGKMQGDDLRQFKNAGVPIYDLLEQYYEAMDAGTDYTHDMLADMQKEGQITAKDVHGALLMATQEGGLYYNAMADMMLGYEGQTEKFRDTTQQTMGELTSSFFELMKSEGLPKLTQLMTDLMNWAKENPEVINNLSKALSDLAVGGLTLVTTGLQELLTFWNENRALFDSMLVLFGGMAFAAGHPLAGAALITVGGYDVWTQVNEAADEDLPPEKTPTAILDEMAASEELRDAVENGKPIIGKESSVPTFEAVEYGVRSAAETGGRVAYGAGKIALENIDVIGAVTDPVGAIQRDSLSNAVGSDTKTTTENLLSLGLAMYRYNKYAESVGGKKYTLKNALRDMYYGLIGLELPEITKHPTPYEILGDAKSQFDGAAGADAYDADQEAFLLESRYSLLGLPDGVVSDMQAMWDAYRAAKQGGYEFDASGYEQRIYSGLHPFYGQYTDDDNVVKEQADLNLATLLEYMSRLSPYSEDLPANWFVYDHADDPWYNPGGGGGNPYDFPAPTSSTDIATLVAAIQGLAQAYNPDAIAAAVESAIIRGMSGVTIEQGNVVLNTGSLVGTLTPILNQKFGALLGRASRG